MNESRFTAVERLVSDCIIAHQETIIVRLIVELEKNYKEIAKLSTLGEYKDDWTHEQVLDYITKEI
jgi:hypothetical protein